MRRSRRDVGAAWIAVALAAAVASAACSSGTANRAGSPSSPAPYVVGVTTLSLASTHVEVWYPVDRSSVGGPGTDSYDVRDWLPPDLASRIPPAVFTYATGAYRNAPAATGPFPLVLFAHGLYSFRDQSTFLTTWLASQGYVVAAPDFPADELATFFVPRPAGSSPPPSDIQVLTDTEHLVTRLSAARGTPLASTVRAGKIAVIGHSQGGIDAMGFASRPEVAAYVAMAAGFRGGHPPLAAVPSLYMAGGSDHAIPAALVRTVYDTAPEPKQLVVLADAGHLAFTDLCLVGAGHGGMASLGGRLHVAVSPGAPFTPSALDGCGPASLPTQAGFAAIRSAVLPVLRSALGP